jgi:ABC-type glycerol-3-phosphate transport system substrate-binding protein
MTPKSSRQLRPRVLAATGDGLAPQDRASQGASAAQRWLLIVLVSFGLGCEARRTASPAGQKENSSTATPPVALRVAVVDDPALGRSIVRQWQAHSQDPIELLEISSEQARADLPPADVAIFPSPLLGDLVSERQVVPWSDRASDASSTDSELSAADDEYDWPDVFPWLRRRELRWGNELYGVSFGSPQLLLLYRSDLLALWQLSPPSTWREYEQLCGAVQDRITASSESAPRFATLEPLSDGWAARCLLARAAAYVQHPNQYSTLFRFTTMESLIAEEPFVRALEELVASVRGLPADAQSLGPDAVLARLLAGDAVMGITWPAAARDPKLPVVPASTFAVQPLPGAGEVYSMSARNWQPSANESAQRVPLLGIAGRMGAVTRQARSAQTSRDFLMWLTRAEVSLTVANSSPATTLFRHSHTAQPQLWVDPPLAPIAGQYVEAMIQNQQQLSAMMMLRIPGADRYLGALDEAVRAAVDGQSTPQEALTEVARQWTELTDELGLDRQRQAYEASLGLAL